MDYLSSVGAKESEGGEEILQFNKDDGLRGEFKLGDVHRRDRFEIKDAFRVDVRIELIVITRLGVNMVKWHRQNVEH